MITAVALIIALMLGATAFAENTKIGNKIADWLIGKING